MSFVLRRKLSTLIPPKIASAANLGGNPNAKRMQQVVAFYKQLPQGPATFKKGNGPIARYQEKFFNGDNASGKPLLHFSIFLLALGYGMEYYFHLRHHKSGAH